MPIPLILFLAYVICFIAWKIFVKDDVTTQAHSYKRVEDVDGSFILVDSGTILQFIESISIIESTINLKTFYGRMLYAENLFNRLKKAYSDDIICYKKDCHYAFNRFKKLYPNMNIRYNYNDLLTNNISELNNHFCTNIVRCFTGYITKMSLELVSLKTQAAKKRRLENVTAFYNECETLLKERGHEDLIDKLKTECTVFTLLYEQVSK